MSSNYHQQEHLIFKRKYGVLRKKVLIHITCRRCPVKNLPIVFQITISYCCDAGSTKEGKCHPGFGWLGGGLGEIDRTDVFESSNERYWCTVYGSLKRFYVPSMVFVLLQKKAFLRKRAREDSQSWIFQKIFNQF